MSRATSSCKRCGSCCWKFNLDLTVKELWAEYERWLKQEGGKPYMEDIYLLAPMVQFVQRGKSGVTWYRCRHLKISKGRATCLIYRHRPRMCRTFCCAGRKEKLKNALPAG